jgi:peptide/nickel transport system ATP-binding protein
VPPLHLLGKGCAFADRCPRAMPRCIEAIPPAHRIGETHAAACWLLEEAATA